MISHASTGHSFSLQEFGEGAHQRRRYSIPGGDAIVGRTPAADLQVADSSVSKAHARLFVEAGILYVEDLGSTNGTYVNGAAAKHSALVESDLLQFGNAIFRIEQDTLDEEESQISTMEQGPSVWSQTLLSFGQMIDNRAVQPHYQPIVDMAGHGVVGTELLARSTVRSLQNPAAMFGAAERLGQSALLSELMREVGSQTAGNSPLAQWPLYCNTHPDEFGTPRLADSLRQLRRQFPDLRLTIEVHEAAIAAADQLRELRALLTDLDMQLAYDDFGAGQGRLLELTEVPADVLKFDMSLIRDIDRAAEPRRDLLRSLVAVARDAGSLTLAEGVETEAEHAACVELGFELGQGFYYGRPMPSQQFATPPPEEVLIA